MTFLLVFVMYFVVGMAFARKRYADALVSYDPEALADAKLELKKIKHVSYCYLQYSSLADQGCNCASQTKWREAHANVKSLKGTKPNSPYIEMGTWPIVLFDSWLKGGKSKKPNYLLIAKMEKELS